MSETLKQNKLTKPPFDSKKFAQELRTHRASMKMGTSVMNEVRSEPRYELATKSTEVLPIHPSKVVVPSD